MVSHTLGEPLVGTRWPSAPVVLIRAGANLVAVGAVLLGRAMIRLGLRRPAEGWRRTVGILLRSESSRFALSAFALRVPDGAAGESIETRIAYALRSFLSQEADAHFSLAWRTPVTVRRRTEYVDVVVLRFARAGTLEAVTPFLAPDGPAAPPPDVRASVHRAIVAAYNRTSRLPEVQRPLMLLQDVLRAWRSGAASWGSDSAQRYVQRLLAACCVSFEPREFGDPELRFTPPAFAARRTLGFGYLSWVARPDADRGSVDLWVSAHHVGLDGVPLQDLLERLERSWGSAGPVMFPRPGAGGTFVEPHPCHAPHEREVDQLIAFVDLSPVLALRRELNAHYREAIGGAVTLGTLIAWLLSQEPEFAGVRIASTIDVAASDGYDRDVDVVSLRPADFATGENPWAGFIAFVREFNRLIAAARTRTSPVRLGMQTSGLLPAWVHATMVRANPAALDETFGTLCVTIIRDARVFLAPMTDLGLRHGFFAIGSADLPSVSGGRVTSVCVKGESGRIAHYPAILQRAIERCASLRAADAVS